MTMDSWEIIKVSGLLQNQDMGFEKKKTLTTPNIAKSITARTYLVNTQLQSDKTFT